MQPPSIAPPQTPSPEDLPEILLVEDEWMARRELKRALTRRGFRVREAANASDAVQQADEGDVGLVLMDVRLGDGPDGIDAAQQIQETHPDTSVIFVSAYAQDADYQQRAQSIPRMMGWLDKPIGAAIPELLRITNRELMKVYQLRSRFLGQDPGRDAAVAVVPGSPPVGVALGARQKDLEALPDQESLEMQIGTVYDEIRTLVARHEGGPAELGRLLRPLREQLRALQEQEADLMERRLRSHFRFDPAEGDRLVQAARSLLKGRRN